ncbi:hypothetical protein [Actinomyces sp.]|uniref:hypothetical protein n=1 Tax=Actinomyces sp. TaxID=29317 RepID=UPI00289D471B|nr:hypothetical protein [Actinomyces sp.]
MPDIALELREISASIGVNAAYGETRSVDGQEFVPVAIVTGGFGSGDDEGRVGAGAGGVSLPVGAYVRRGDRLHFAPNPVVALAVGVPFAYATARALVGVIRALKG